MYTYCRSTDSTESRVKDMKNLTVKINKIQKNNKNINASHLKFHITLVTNFVVFTNWSFLSYDTEPLCQEL